MFEGDRERYWIPVDSILEVKHEFYAEAAQNGSPSLQHFIIVRAMTANGPWETSLYRRQDKFRMHTAKRKLGNILELESRIRELMKGTPVVG